MERKIKFRNSTFTWRLDMESFYEAENTYRQKFTIGECSYVTMGGFPRLMWAGFLAHEIDTGEPAPTLSEVVKWCSRKGTFNKYLQLVVDSLDAIATGDESEEAEELTEEQQDAPFLTGGQSNESG